ncbi:hypothetical protein D0S45_00490 [Marinifilum sp. JC120]|nr:hypothetical protein D0S45_00490 [Marinifilum sp. JC120]
MIMDTATIIIFAIRASIKIGEAGYKSYVDITRNRELVLPLPRMPELMTNTRAWRLFFNEEGEARHFVDGDNERKINAWPKLQNFKEKTLESLTEEELETLLELAKQAKMAILLEEDPKFSLSNIHSISALHTVQGWEKGLSTATAVQHVAGTIIEVGVDFLQLNPQLFNTNTSEGKLIKHFIDELDQIDFSEETLDNLPVLLFAATLETVSSNSQIFGNNKNVHALIGNSANKIATLVKDRNNKINQTGLTATEKRNKRFEMEEWGELVFRGILDASARTAISDPGNFLGIQGEASQEIAKRIGDDVLELMIGDDSIEFKPIFSQAGAERLTKTALAVISKHPKLITNSDDKINKLLSEIAAGLAGTNMPLFDDAMLPEVARIMLEKTGENLDLLWPNDQHSPKENILFIATQATIKALTDSNPDYPYWRPDFTHAEMLMVVESVCDEIKSNPAWITGNNDNYNTALNLALTQTVACLKARKTDISVETSAKIIAEVIKGIALREELLKETIFADGGRKNIAAAAIDAMISSIFDCPDDLIKWRLCRDEVLQEIVKVLMSELADSKASPEAVNSLKSILDSFINDIKDGGKIDFAKLKELANKELQAIS